MRSKHSNNAQFKFYITAFVYSWRYCLFAQKSTILFKNMACHKCQRLKCSILEKRHTQRNICIDMWKSWMAASVQRISLPGSWNSTNMLSLNSIYLHTSFSLSSKIKRSKMQNAQSKPGQRKKNGKCKYVLSLGNEQTAQPSDGWKENEKNRPSVKLNQWQSFETERYIRFVHEKGEANSNEHKWKISQYHRLESNCRSPSNEVMKVCKAIYKI